MVAAIVSDYDVDLDHATAQIRAVLDALKEDAGQTDDAERERSTGDEMSLASASTSSGRRGGDYKTGRGSPTMRQELASAFDDTDTDVTCLSEAMATLNIKDPYDASSSGGSSSSSSSSDNVVADGLPLDDDRVLATSAPESKQARLMETFPDLHASVVAQTLADVGNEYDKAIDQLLNRVFLEGEYRDDEPGDGDVPKGVDGFATPDDEVGGRRAGAGGKKRWRKMKGQPLGASGERQTASSSSSSPSRLPSEGVAQAAAPRNAWQTAVQDIDFLASRLNMSKANIASTYHAGNASLEASLRVVLEFAIEGLRETPPEDWPIEVDALELTVRYPNLSYLHALGLVRLAPTVEAADELAEKLNNMAPRSQVVMPIEIIAKLPPIKPSPPSPELGAYRGAGGQQFSDMSGAEATRLAAHHRATAQRLCAQAAVAHRKANSDHLRHSEAGFYSHQRGAHEAQARRYEAVVAQRLVAAQSTADELDLHGLAVRDAVGITRQRVRAWWDGLGDARFDHRVRATAPQCRVVTGLGRHSTDGRPKIGPAVGKMLLREGWRVQFGQGVLTVTGLARR